MATGEDFSGRCILRCQNDRVCGTAGNQLKNIAINSYRKRIFLSLNLSSVMLKRNRSQFVENKERIVSFSNFSIVSTFDLLSEFIVLRNNIIICQYGHLKLRCPFDRRRIIFAHIVNRPSVIAYSHFQD